MGWIVRERRGVRWKHQTQDSISAPLLPLVVVFGILMALKFLEVYLEFKERVERSKMMLKFALMLMPAAAVLVVKMSLLGRRLWRYIGGGGRRAVYRAAAAEEGSSAWGLMVVLGLLLVMVYYQRSFQSALFRL